LYIDEKQCIKLEIKKNKKMTNMPVLILFAKYDEVANKRGHVHIDNS